MSQRPVRPFRITRRPEITPSSPSTPRLGGNTGPSSASLCPRCGSWIGDKAIHDEFHDGIAALAEWAAIAERLMREHLAPGSFPADGDTASDGDNATTDGK